MSALDEINGQVSTTAALLLGEKQVSLIEAF
jgi:hypothetical protein